jgi:hypothetical protein
MASASVPLMHVYAVPIPYFGLWMGSVPIPEYDLGLPILLAQQQQQYQGVRFQMGGGVNPRRARQTRDPRRTPVKCKNQPRSPKIKTHKPLYGPFFFPPPNYAPLSQPPYRIQYVLPRSATETMLADKVPTNKFERMVYWYDRGWMTLATVLYHIEVLHQTLPRSRQPPAPSLAAIQQATGLYFAKEALFFEHQFQKNQSVRWAFKRLWMLWLARKKFRVVANLFNPITLESTEDIPAKYRLTLYCHTSKKAYVHDVRDLHRAWHNSLAQGDAFFPQPRLPFNPFTNIPFGLREQVAIVEAFRSANLVQSELVTLFGQCKFNLSDMERYARIPLLNHCSRSYFANLQDGLVCEDAIDILVGVYDRIGRSWCEAYTDRFTSIFQRTAEGPLKNAWRTLICAYVLHQNTHYVPPPFYCVATLDRFTKVLAGNLSVFNKNVPAQMEVIRKAHLEAIAR